jgi:hypothetical protein
MEGTIHLLLHHVEYVDKCKVYSNRVHHRIREFAPHVPIYMFTPDGSYEMMTLDALMPKSFGPENLHTLQHP